MAKPHPTPGPRPSGGGGEALETLFQSFDPEWGGFLPAPKFPQGPLLLYLLALAWRGEERAKALLPRTLQAMALGGIYDQVGGGFHRYSVDRFWRLPHFEKMLYDNALLARAYLGAYKLFGKPFFLRVARETLGWLLSMQHREGGFFTALDAESEGEEGRYYTWTEAELKEALGEDFPLARRYFALGEDLGERSVLTAWGEEEVAQVLGENLPRWREGVRARLLAARRKRHPPFLDDKVLADGSALAVRALAEAGRLMGERAYLEAARKGAHFLLQKMQRNGLLRHTWWRGTLGEEAFLADQAFAALALLEIYGSTGEWPYLEQARVLAERAWAEFGPGQGSSRAPLPLPAAGLEEGATPTGESALAEALWRLGGIFAEEGYRERAWKLLEARALWLGRYPHALPGFLLAHRLLREGSELALPLPSSLAEEALGLYLPLTQLVLDRRRPFLP